MLTADFRGVFVREVHREVVRWMLLQYYGRCGQYGQGESAVGIGMERRE
jgi:hypothetical protein